MIKSRVNKIPIKIFNSKISIKILFEIKIIIFINITLTLLGLFLEWKHNTIN